VNEDPGSNALPPATRPANSEILAVLKALRFAFVSAVLFLSYFPLRFTLATSAFRNILRDMLEGRRLPVVSQFVFSNETFLLILSLLLPAAAIATLFWKNLRKSFYALGIITLIALFHFAIVFDAFWTPLTTLTDQLGQAQ
jgi:hypothetical protein